MDSTHFADTGAGARTTVLARDLPWQYRLTMKPLKSDVFQAMFSVRCSSESRWAPRVPWNPLFKVKLVSY